MQNVRLEDKSRIVGASELIFTQGGVSLKDISKWIPQFQRIGEEGRKTILTGTPPEEILGVPSLGRFEFVNYSNSRQERNKKQRLEFSTRLNQEQPLISTMINVPFNFCGKHAHLTAQDYRTLFGEEMPESGIPLVQPGQYAIKQIERAKLSLKENKTIEGCAIVGGPRQNSQFEITEDLIRKFGLEGLIPHRDSGSIIGAPTYRMAGPKGEIAIPVICPVDHIHIGEEQEKYFSDGEKVLIRFKSQYGIDWIYPNVKVRYGGKPEIHINGNKLMQEEANREKGLVATVFKYNLK